MQKYKIALISDWYYPKVGGIEYSINSLATNLQALGHSIDIITRKYPDIPKTDMGDNLPVIRLEGNVPTVRFLSPKIYRTLYNTLKCGNYDIIHVHGLDSPMAMISLPIAKIIGIPRIVTNHSLVGNIPFKLPVLMAGKLFLRLADAVIAVSSAVEKESKIMSRGAVYLIPNGIDTRSPNGAVQPISIDKTGKIVITTVSRMTKKKGVEDLVKIAALLLKKYKTLLFVMVGDGPLKEKLEKMGEDLKISRNFLFTGEVSRGTVLHLLEQSDIFVLPSKREAFGISILEAFSKKIPVVARNHSGVLDIIAHARTGFLADNNYEMAKYIEELINRPELAQSLSTAAYDEISKYQWQDIAKRVEDIYSRTIYKKNSGFC